MFIFQLHTNLPLIRKLAVHIKETSLQVDMTVSGCHDAYYFMVTTVSSCSNCLKLDSEDHGSGDLDDTDDVEDFTSTDGGHVSLETGNSAKNIQFIVEKYTIYCRNLCKLQLPHYTSPQHYLYV